MYIRPAHAASGDNVNQIGISKQRTFLAVLRSYV